MPWIARTTKLRSWRQIVFLNCVLDGAILVPTMRKAVAVLAEGLISENSRGDKIRLELFCSALSDLQTSDPMAFAGLKSLIGQNRKQLK